MTMTQNLWSCTIFQLASLCRLAVKSVSIFSSSSLLFVGMFFCAQAIFMKAAAKAAMPSGKCLLHSWSTWSSKPGGIWTLSTRLCQKCLTCPALIHHLMHSMMYKICVNPKTLTGCRLWWFWSCEAGQWRLYLASHLPAPARSLLSSALYIWF